MKTQGKKPVYAFIVLRESARTTERKKEATRKQLKHDMLLTFMAQSKAQQQKQAAKPRQRSLLKSLLSIFL